MKKSILTLIVSILIIGKSYGCFCEGPDIETENFKEYDEVFIGKVLEIKRFEVTGKYDNGDKFIFVGTETVFEIKKKWKGNNQRIIKIFQDASSCSYQFLIDSFDYLVSASNRKFTNNHFKRKMGGLYLMTDVCELNINESEKEKFHNAIESLDRFFSDELELQRNSRNWTFLLIGLSIIAIPILIKLIKKENEPAN